MFVDYKDFVHLHLHTKYSLADAMIKPKELAKKLKSLGMNKVAISDHGEMFGVLNFYQALKYEGIETIVGMETYVAPRFNTIKENKIDDRNYHLVLLCENNTGYQNLMKIASDAAINGFYRKPRTDKRILSQYHEGIIALSGCLGSEVDQLIMGGKNEEVRDEATRYELAKEAALQYDDIFGRGNFYLELQDHRIPAQALVNVALIRMSKETGIPLVATNDCHYLERGDAKNHDILMAIQAKTTVDDTKRKKYDTDEFYVKSAEEMRDIFIDTPEAISNTKRIADRCHVDIEFGVNKLPPFDVRGYKGTNYEFIKEITYKNAEELYGALNDETTDRIEYELSIIERMGYTNYFLINWDFFRFCREGTKEFGTGIKDGWKPILTGPGRGSAAGSIVTYCLGITKIDPLRYNLMFERFL